MLPIVLGLACSLTLPALRAQEPEATGSAAVDSWETLEAEYEAAFVPWAQERLRSGAWSEPAGEDAPDARFRPRFEALARAGEGRATLWLLQNTAEGDGQAATRRTVLELVRAAGDADWVEHALVQLARIATDLGPEVQEHLRALSAEGHPPALRATALLAQGALPGVEREARLELALSAALLRWRSGVPSSAELGVEAAQELAVDALADLEQDHNGWWETCFKEADDGTYYSRPAFWPDPREDWEPAIEALAERGAPVAQAYMLFDSRQRNGPVLERRKGWLEALVHTPLDARTRKELGYNLKYLMQEMGAEFVEECVVAVIDGAPDEERATLLFGLGDGLCSAGDSAARERGLELLREVHEGWPESNEGKRAEGRVFRYTNLVIGKPVPDFETEDADGNAFKLSDYAGKVTVIDFWGFW